MKTRLSTSFSQILRLDFLGLLVSLLLVASTAFLIWSKTPRFPIAVPLWFSKPWGQEWLAAPVFLWLVPLIGFLITFINFSLAYFFSTRERLLSLLLVGSSVIVCGLLFYSLLNIILVVT